MKRVSVVVPTFNQSQYLTACLDSIWFQDYQDIEIIVVNDGSTDNTMDVLHRFEWDVREGKTSFACLYDEKDDEVRRCIHDRYPKEGRAIQIIDTGRNEGLSSALNSGFRACTGEYCTYVPSDNICYPSMIADLAVPLDAGDADFSYGDMLIFQDDGRILRRFSLPDYSFESCFSDWYLCGVAKLYKTELHARWGYYDETLLAHDHELFLRFAVNGVRFFHVPRALMGVRDHGEGRQIHIHDPANWNRLYEESKELVKRAREMQQTG